MRSPIGVQPMANENQELRKAGLKVTLPRVKILQILESSKDRHMSAEDVFKALLEAGEEVGIATVYRVLTQFEDAGLVESHNFDGGHKVFELDNEVIRRGERRTGGKINPLEPRTCLKRAAVFRKLRKRNVLR